MTEAAIDGQSAPRHTEPDELAVSGADLAAYTRVYEEHNARLVAYALSLTGNPSTAEDLVAEAHFRVWRRISAGHAVENVPAYLAVTVRNLATTLHRTTSEVLLPAQATEAADPSQRVAHVDFVARLLKDLPERWVRALWLAEVEDLPLEAVGERIGANSNATAVLLNRAREGLRQAFLRGYPGLPVAEACAKHWQRMPSLVRGGLSARQTDSVRMHAEQCEDCGARLAALRQVNLRLPALLGPAVLVFTVGGGGLRLLAVAGGGGAAGAAGAAGAKTVGVAGVARQLRHRVSSSGKVTAVSAGVVATAAAVAVAAAAVSGGGHSGGGGRPQGAGSAPGKAVGAPVPELAKPADPSSPAPVSVTPVPHTPRNAAPSIPAAAPPPPTASTQTPATPSTPQPSTTPPPSAPPPASPTPDPDIHIVVTVPALPQMTVTLHLAPNDDSPGPNNDHSSKSPG